MNYKKSILSLAAVLALNSTVTADPNATYLPLTTQFHDRAWVMFGVNDFSTGKPTIIKQEGLNENNSIVKEASNTDELVSPSKAVIDANATDTLFISSNGKNMATFQVLNGSITDDMWMGIGTKDVPYSETQPVRSMYIAIQKSSTDTNTVPNVKLNYKADLETREIEIVLGSRDSKTVYKATISEASTFNNPAIAKVREDAEDKEPEVDSMKPSEVLAYDLSNSPILASAYSTELHQGSATNTKEKFYHYDAANGRWLLWDNTKTDVGTNDLDKFEVTKAYWGRMDINSDGTTTSTTRAGLYLGKVDNSSRGNVASETRYSGKLVPNSWNMMAFDPASHPDIRNAATGLLIDTDLTANDTFIVLDETGTNSVTVTVTDTDENNLSMVTNKTIESAKIAGLVPDTFNVKAFDINGSAIAFMSDKQFTIKNLSGDPFSTVKSLAGKKVIETISGEVNATNITTDGATSVYGEYAFVVKPLVGANTASDLAQNKTGGNDGNHKESAAVRLGNIDGDNEALDLIADGATSDLDHAIAQLKTSSIFTNITNTANPVGSNGLVTQIDLDNNGTANMVILAADKPFYIKDNTFTRVYKIDEGVDGLTNAAGLETFEIVPYTIPMNVKPTDTNITGIEEAINIVADDTNTTGIFADQTSDGKKIVIVTTDSQTFNIRDVDSATIDYFKVSKTGEDIAQGAIQGIYNIAELAREKVITNKFTMQFTAEGTGDDNVTIGLNGESGPEHNNTSTDYDETKLLLDTLVDDANKILKDNNISAFASHNYTDEFDGIKQAIITVEGIGITDLNITAPGSLDADDGVEQNDDNGKLKIGGASIISDLKANAVYTPDYVNYGPLYTLKSSGYEAKTIIRASTDINQTATTHWDHIDLTRDPKDWLKNNEFNLFNINNHAGYWAYITDYTLQNDIAEANKNFKPHFIHHFNTKTGVTENLIDSSSFGIELNDGSETNGQLNKETSNAKLVISGNEVQLTKGPNSFSSVISDPETGLEPGSTLAIKLRATDGVGEAYENDSFILVDYEKPAKPTVEFISGANMAVTDTSADVASYYIWRDFIPDNVQSFFKEKLLPADVASYNICQDPQSNFGSEITYQIIALDHDGVISSSNASDIKQVVYRNTIKGATVLTANSGVNSVMSYDATNCLADANPITSGVEIQDVVNDAKALRLSYKAKEGTEGIVTDLPLTSYYSVNNTLVMQIKTLAIYAGAKFYVEFDGGLYTGNFANESDAEASGDSYIHLTPVTAENQRLD